MGELSKYKNIVSFLGQALGSNYEIVLHWKDKNNSFYIAEIQNSQVSGRTVNSPITGFALKLVNEKIYEKKDFVDNYVSKTSNGHRIKGSTYFIKDENNDLLGLLCINFDTDFFVQLADNLLNFTGLVDNSSGHALNDFISNNITEKDKQHTTVNADEILHSNVDDIIKSSIDPGLIRPGVSINPETKQAIIQKLYDKGVFQIKGVMPHVAKLLSISEPSVYRYLKKVSI